MATLTLHTVTVELSGSTFHTNDLKTSYNMVEKNPTVCAVQVEKMQRLAVTMANVHILYSSLRNNFQPATTIDLGNKTSSN